MIDSPSADILRTRARLAGDAVVRPRSKYSANEGLASLASGIAHDLNNELVGVLGNADLALWVLPEDHPGRGFVEQVESSARRLSRLVNQLRAYAGSRTVVSEAVDIAQLCRDSRLLLAEEAPDTRILVDTCPDLPQALTDPQELVTVLQELVRNARESGAKTIQVSCGMYELDWDTIASLPIPTTLAPGCYPCVEVCDDGAGMDGPTRERMLDPYFTTKPPHRGLGLTSVRKLLSTGGGGVKVQSEPGTGTVVTLLLPAHIAPAAPISAEASISAEGLVLVVDDVDVVRHVASAILKRRGFATVVASTAEDAILAMRAHRPSAVLLDLTLPDRPAAELLPALRDISPTTPIVVMSGWGAHRATEQLGEVVFLGKPFTEASLVDALRQAFP